MNGALAISSGTIAAIVAVLAIDLFAVPFGLSFMRTRRAQRSAAEPRLPSVRAETAAKALGPVFRPEFFRRSLVTSLTVRSSRSAGSTDASRWRRPTTRGTAGPRGKYRVKESV